MGNKHFCCLFSPSKIFLSPFCSCLLRKTPVGQHVSYSNSNCHLNKQRSHISFVANSLSLANGIHHLHSANSYKNKKYFLQLDFSSL